VSDVFPSNPLFDEPVANARVQLDSLGYTESYIAGHEKEKPKIHLKANFFASGTGWRQLMSRPELAVVVRAHIEYLASQASTKGGHEGAPNVREFPEQLFAGWVALVEFQQNGTGLAGGIVRD